MDKLKGAAKDGWSHRPVHRDSWKTVAGVKKKDPYEAQRNHTSAPLTTLRDPDSFGAPPKHTGAIGSSPSSPSTPARPQPSGGLGSVVPAPSTRQQQQQLEEEEPPKPTGPYRADTTGLRTDNLPPPPARRGEGQAPAPPPRHAAAASPPPVLPSRQPQQTQARAPAPFLPPRMNENPDEFTPPPPPTYTEATRPGQRDPAALNTDAISRLSQAGVSVPGLGIGNSPPSTSQSPTVNSHSGQLSELQQRFNRMNAGSQNVAPSSSVSSPSSPIGAAAHKKPPPPPPPKKAGLGGGNDSRPSSGGAGIAPPPLPLSSKPRPPP